MNNSNRSNVLPPSSSSLRPRPVSQYLVRHSPSSITNENNRVKQMELNGDSGLISRRPKSVPRHMSSVRSLPAEEINKTLARRAPSTVSKSFSHKKRCGEEEALVKERVDKNEALIRDLQTQVSELKSELEQAHKLNSELQSVNEKLSRDLAAVAEAKAKAKVDSATTATAAAAAADVNGHDNKNSRFKDIQKMIADKLQRPIAKFDSTGDKRSAPKQPIPLPINAPRNSFLPPPPPPPLPVRPTTRVSTTKVEPISADRRLKHTGNSPETSSSIHSSIVGEIQRRSAHLLAIKADVEAKGEAINNLIKTIHETTYSHIEDVVKFADWLDIELSSLADERAVLKHFNWPESKADAIREAAVEYRCLDHIHQEISSYKDDNSIPCAASLKKMAALLDRSEQSLQRLIKLRKNALVSYQQFKIPTDWMLDSGLISKIKIASRILAKIYAKRVMTEFESDRRSLELVIQCVDFAHRAQLFAGGLDSETLGAFEEIRRHVPSHVR